jgi:hypothetical protein
MTQMIDSDCYMAQKKSAGGMIRPALKALLL